MKLTTTLSKIRACYPCTQSWQTLLKSLGPGFDSKAEINLLTILKSNGVLDMLWCLRATDQNSRLISAQLAIEFAEEVLPIFEEKYPVDQRPKKAIQAARDYLDRKISRETLKAYQADAYVAAAAADTTAYTAVAAAAADTTAYTAAVAYAAHAAAYAAAAADTAAHAAAYAAHAAAYAAAAADTAAHAAAYAAAAADTAAHAAAYAAAAADTIDARIGARKKMQARQAEIIEKYLEW